MTERYARMCLEHRRILEQRPDLTLRCSAGEGGHVVAEGGVGTYDRVKGTVTPPEGGGGEERIAMPRQPREESPAAPPRKKGGVLDRAKFTDENGAVLFIRLEQKRESLTVRWQRIEGEKSTSGGLAIEAELAAARAAFERAKKDAVANEWQPTAIVWGQAVKMLPLPKANVRARKRVA